MRNELVNLPFQNPDIPCTVDELAHALKVPPSEVLEWIEKKELHVTKHGGSYLITATDVHTFYKDVLFPEVVIKWMVDEGIPKLIEEFTAQKEQQTASALKSYKSRKVSKHYKPKNRCTMLTL